MTEDELPANKCTSATAAECRKSTRITQVDADADPLNVVDSVRFTRVNRV